LQENVGDSGGEVSITRWHCGLSLFIELICVASIRYNVIKLSGWTSCWKMPPL